LRSGTYCGNKPTGGLWTSTYLSEGEYLSDWHRGRATNRLIQMAYPNNRLPAWLLDIEPDAQVLRVGDLSAALDFTQRYHLGTIPLQSLGLPAIITPEITDWETALHDYDAVLLTAEAADEIAFAAVAGKQVTAFHTWNCESMIAGKWIFRNVRRAPEQQ